MTMKNDKFNLKKYRIASIEAQDIINAQSIDSEKGYTLLDSSGNRNYGRYNNILPPSLDTLELEDCVYKTVRNRNAFSFSKDNADKEILYTNIVVNIKFSICLKDYIKRYDTTYVKQGFKYDSSLLNDSIYIENDEIKMIKLDVPVESPVEFESDYFTVSEMMINDDEIETCYKLKENVRIKNIDSTEDLRRKLYKDGFRIDGVKYVRYKRSSDASRDGHCLFIMEDYYEKMNKWSKCGLNIKDGDKLDLPSFEAYQSLSLSSIIETLNLKKENFLFVDDVKCELKNEKVIEIRESDSVLGRKLLKAEEVDNSNVVNNIWDGEALMDKSVFDSSPLIKGKGMALLRGRYFKTCAFNTNLTDWFKEKGITDVNELNGITFAQTIEDIKIVVTNSSVKYLKFRDFIKGNRENKKDNRFVYEYFLNQHGETFGIVKTEKKTSHFDGHMVTTSYQLLNTLRLDRPSVEAFLKDSYDYLLKIKTRPEYMKFYLSYSNKYSFDDYFLDMNDDYEDNIDDLSRSIREYRNDIIYKLLGLSSKFFNTELFKNFKNDIDKSYKNSLKKGHVLVHGTNATLFGNGYELLQNTIGEFDKEKPSGILGKYEIYSKMFDDDRRILGARSPHVTMGNILLAKNTRREEFDKWFNLTQEIVCVDAISTNLQQMLNGCDYDSDTMLLTDNEILINSASEFFERFRVPVNTLEPSDKEYILDSDNKTDVDYLISNNLVGQIINLSQYLNSILWDKYNNGKDDEIDDIYKDITILACLSGMEIDKAKRMYGVDTPSVLKMIRDRYKSENGTIRPYFFKTISNKSIKSKKKDQNPENDFKKNKTVYDLFDTTMDYIYQSVDAESERQKRSIKIETIDFLDCFIKFSTPKGETNYTDKNKKVKDIEEYIDFTYEERRKLLIDFETRDKNEKTIRMKEATSLLVSCVSEIKKKLDSEYVCYKLLEKVFKGKPGKTKRVLLYAFFNSESSAFKQLIINTAEELPILEIKRDENGNIQKATGDPNEISIHQIQFDCLLMAVDLTKNTKNK